MEQKTFNSKNLENIMSQMNLPEVFMESKVQEVRRRTMISFWWKWGMTSSRKCCGNAMRPKKLSKMRLAKFKM